jgi:hypothetical protein
MKEGLKNAGLYIGFVAVAFIVLCIAFANNKVDPNDPRNLCPKELKNSLEFHPEKVLGYTVADLIHCFGNFKWYDYSFLYGENDNQKVFTRPYLDGIEDKIIINYESKGSSGKSDDGHDIHHYQFLVVDKNSKKIEESGVKIK